ncbi:MAG: hypothetical protein WA096_04250, partial [Smithella sp.]
MILGWALGATTSCTSCCSAVLAFSHFFLLIAPRFFSLHHNEAAFHGGITINIHGWFFPLFEGKITLF